jgi:hypothetical protein
LKLLRQVSSDIFAGGGVIETNNLYKCMPIREDKASKSAINLHQIDININKINNEINNGSSSSCFE